jgi:hypothetical protein
MSDTQDGIVINEELVLKLGLMARFALGERKNSLLKIEYIIHFHD